MTHYETRRQLIDIALTAGRAMQSPQTRYVHYCPFKKDEPSHDTIPVLENFLFAMALVASNSIDFMEEGQKMIVQLLEFQGKDGNFPLYLHDYPKCSHRTQALDIAPIFHWLVKKFATQLTKPVKQKVEEAFHKLFHYIKTLEGSENFPFHLQVRIEACKKVFGEKDNLEQLEKRCKDNPPGALFVSEYLGEIAASLQMAFGQISKSPWQDFWHHLGKVWHQESVVYAGPAICEGQYGDQPKTSLLDFYMGSLCLYPYRVFYPFAEELKAILVQPEEGVIGPRVYPLTYTGTLGNLKWAMHQESKFAMSCIQFVKGANPSMEKKSHPFRLVWGDVNHTHSLVVQGGEASFVDFEQVEGGVDLFFNLDELPEPPDREKEREINFFIDQDEAVEITLGGQKATTFNLGETLTMQAPKMHIELTFSLVSGSGRMLGHIHPGNRPSQEKLRGKDRFSVYDWQVFIRNVGRQQASQIVAKLRFK